MTTGQYNRADVHATGCSWPDVALRFGHNFEAVRKKRLRLGHEPLASCRHGPCDDAWLREQLARPLCADKPAH